MATAPDAPPNTPPLDDLTLRAIDAYSKRRGLDADARRLLLSAIQDLTLCFLSAWNQMRETGTTSEMLFADLLQTRFQLDEARDWAEILAACRAEVQPRRRNHYTPPLRFRVLQHTRKYMLTIDQTADRFVVTTQTIRNWLDDLERHPGATTVGKPLVDPQPPIRRFTDATRRLIQEIMRFGVGGKKKIARTLMKLGLQVHPSTVGRIVKEPPLAAPPPPAPSGPNDRPTTVRGDYPNHLVLIDITRIPLLFPFLYLHLVAILDAFSRLPLALSVHFAEPSASDAVTLLERTIHTHGKPKHLVADQGPQFTSQLFENFVDRQGIRMRLGKVGEFHSISLIDRFFRTLKESLGIPRLRPWDFRGFADFKRRLNLALVHYSYVRPHEAIDGFAPIEKYYGIRGHLPTPISPPRGRPGDPGPEIPFEVAYLDPENQAFPLVFPKAA